MHGVMQRINPRIVALIAALLLGAGLIYHAVGDTSTTLGDVKKGGVTGTIGKVEITTSGGAAVNDPTFTWSNMAPGEYDTLTVNYKNTGTLAQDVYLTFPNETALSALNTLGTYGEVEVVSNGDTVYHNANLNDKPNNGTSGLPKQLKLQEGLAVNHTGTFTFKFRYAEKLGGAQGATHLSGGGAFNLYPVAGQVTVRSGDGTGSGLPFAVAAIQHGHQL